MGLHLALRSAPPSEANADRTGRYACTLSKDKVKITLLRSALIVDAALISSMGALAQVKLGDPHDPVKECSAAFGVKGIPHTVIISRDGNIKKIFRGYSEESLPDVVEEVANALNE